MDDFSWSLDHLIQTPADALYRAVNNPGELGPVVAVPVFP